MRLNVIYLLVLSIAVLLPAATAVGADDPSGEGAPATVSESPGRDGEGRQADATAGAEGPLEVLKPDQRPWYRKIRRIAVEKMARATTEEYLEAEKDILAIDAPEALEPMAMVLYTPHIRWRSTFVKAARRYAAECPEPIIRKLAVSYLADMAARDPNGILRGKARSALFAEETPLHTYRLRQLALETSSNEVRNRAAELLAELGDRSAMVPLVEVLTTEEMRPVSTDDETRNVQTNIRARHVGSVTFRRVPIEAAGAGAGARGFIQLPTVSGASVNTTTSAPADRKADIEWKQVTVKHPAVLRSLVELSGGKSFGYDKTAWREWLREEGIIPKASYEVDWGDDASGEDSE